MVPVNRSLIMVYYKIVSITSYITGVPMLQLI